jgi:uncharacterized membrane protein HdeD (DUF308 family)
MAWRGAPAEVDDITWVFWPFSTSSMALGCGLRLWMLTINKPEVDVYMVRSMSKRNKGLLSGLLLLLIGVAMAAYSGYKMKIELDNIYFWIFWLGVLIIIGSIIFLLTSLQDEDYISEPEEKLFDRSLEDLPPIGRHEKK